jgi:phosphoglycerate kinase
VAQGLDATEGTVVAADAVPEGTMALDIGPKTVEALRPQRRAGEDRLLERADGPLRDPPFSAGTFDIARALAASDGFTVVGGGDSAAAVKRRRRATSLKGFNHISTGGGASLELIEGKKLPGIEVLRTAP